MEHLRLVFRGRRSTWSTSRSFCVASATLEQWAPSSFWRRSDATWSTQARFAWQAQHLEHLHRGRAEVSFTLRVHAQHLEHHQARFAWQARRSTWSTSGSCCRGTRSTWSTFIEVRGSLATSDANGRRLVLRGRRSASGAQRARFAMAGTALGAPPAHFAMANTTLRSTS